MVNKRRSKTMLGNQNGFKKGQLAWNKGIKGVNSHMFGKKNGLGNKAWNKGIKTGLISKTAFKKGSIPWNKGRMGIFKMSEETKKKISGKVKGNKHWNFGKQSSLTKEHFRKAGLKGALSLYSRKYTRLEEKVYKFLENIKVVFKKQYLINNKFLVDVYIPDRHLVVEVDGNYWHTLDRVVRKDKAENAYLGKCGFNVLRLKEEEINNGQYERRLLKWV